MRLSTCSFNSTTGELTITGDASEADVPCVQASGGWGDDPAFPDILGNDTVDGGTGDDYLHAGAGNDLLRGGDGSISDGDDVLSGDDGDDILQAADGYGDVLYGGNGTDTARLNPTDPETEGSRDLLDSIPLSDIEYL